MTTPVLTIEEIDSFCVHMQNQGRKRDTVSGYRQSLLGLNTFLTNGKKLTEKSIHECVDWLQQQYDSRHTVNTKIAALNSFLLYKGRRDLCTGHILAENDEPQPTLTRDEYYRLLQTAKLQENDRLYFLVKVFATVGLSVQELPKLTVQAVREGRIKLQPKEAPLIIPDCLQRELLEYIEENGLREGAVFLDRNGGPLSRTAVVGAMKRLCKDARVEEEKVNPRCLIKLCNATRDSFYAEMIKLAWRDYERFLESEQPVYGWKSIDGIDNES